MSLLLDSIRAAADQLPAASRGYVVVVPPGYEHADLLRAAGVPLVELRTATGGLLYVIDPDTFDEEWL